MCIHQKHYNFSGPCDNIDILESLDQDTSDARQTWFSRMVIRMNIGILLRELLSIARIGRSERIIKRAENKRRRVGSRIRSNEV